MIANVRKRRIDAVSRTSILLFLALSSAGRMSAQTAGTTSGRVGDSTGAAIPDATITLMNLGTGTSRNGFGV